MFSVDLDGVQEFTRKIGGEGGQGKSHKARMCKMSLEECLGISDAVVSGVSSLAVSREAAFSPSLPPFQTGLANHDFWL